MPTDLKAWVRDDFRRARHDGEPRLTDAVVILGKAFMGVTKENKNDKAAKLLTNLLRYEGPKSDGAKTPGGANPQPRGPAVPGRGGKPGVGGYIPLDGDIIRSIVYALLVNDSNTSHQTISEILRGDFPTDDDRVATEAVLQCLAALSMPDHDAILLRVLTNPDSIRPAGQVGASGVVPGIGGKSAAPGSVARGVVPGLTGSTPGRAGPARGPATPNRGPGQGPMTGAEMQALAMTLVSQSDSPALRTKLAGLLIEGTTSNDTRATVLPMFYAAQPQSLAAQMVLYHSDLLDKGTRAYFEGYFAKYSSAALAQLMKVTELPPSKMPATPAGGRGPIPRRRSAGPGPGRRVAATRRPRRLPARWNAVPGFNHDVIVGLAVPLWSADFLKLVETRLDTANSFAEDAGTIVLASTIPVDAIRASSTTCWKHNAKHRGPRHSKTPVSAGTSSPTPRSGNPEAPAERRPHVVRRRIYAEHRNRQEGQGHARRDAVRHAGRPRQGTGNSNRTVGDDDEQIGAGRLRTAEGRRGLGRHGGSSPAADKRPVQIPATGVQVTSEYHVDWPTGLADKAKLAGAVTDPMVLHYVRFETNNSVNRVKQLFIGPKRPLATPRPIQHDSAAGVWIESFQRRPEHRPHVLGRPVDYPERLDPHHGARREGRRGPAPRDPRPAGGRRQRRRQGGRWQRGRRRFPRRNRLRDSRPERRHGTRRPVRFGQQGERADGVIVEILSIETKNFAALEVDQTEPEPEPEGPPEEEPEGPPAE